MRDVRNPRIVGGFITALNGWNADVATAFEPLWDVGGAYTHIDHVTGVTASVSSDNAADTSAGTGARTVRVKGIDSSGNLFSEVVTLTGTTEVPLTTDPVLAINSIEVMTVGSGGVPAGNIYVGSGVFTLGVPATVHAKCLAGNNQTYMAIVTLPKGTHYLASHWASTAKPVTTDFAHKLRFRVNEGPWRDIHVQYTTDATYHDDPYWQLIDNSEAGLIDIEIQALVSAGTEPVTAGCQIVSYTSTDNRNAYGNR